jgi:hypothetical protein
MSFDEQLARLDVGVFDRLPSQSSRRARRSLLACQAAVRRRFAPYTYLEIGSYRGGSLQPHVLDASCARIYSIDPRPATQADAGGVAFTYHANSTERMLRELDQLAPDARSRITTFDLAAPAVPREAIAVPPQLCFIDGEHTDEALARDFAFCRAVLARDGLILCHDAPVVYNGLTAIVDALDAAGGPYRVAHLPDTIFAFEFGEARLLDDPALQPVMADAALGYLFSLRYNDYYRRLANRWPLRAYRAARVWWSGANVAD